MKQLIKNFRRSFNQHGDTIVEVMMALAILSIILAVSYATSARSLQTGLNSQSRNQALAYAQGQLELIKNADNSTGQSVTIGSYEIQNRAFCIDPSNGQVVNVDPDTGVCALPIGSTAANSQFSVADTYDATQKTFTITVSWSSASNRPQQAVAYYKPHNSFVTTSGAFDPCASDENLCFTYITNPPPVAISFTGTPQSVNYKGATTLKWSAVNIQGTTCTASASPANANWTGSKATSSTVRSQSISNLTASTTFTLTCIGFNDSPASASVDIKLAPATVHLTASPTKVTYNGTTTLSWTVSNSPGPCTASASPANASWTGSKGLSGSQAIKNLLVDTTFSITCPDYESGTETLSVAVPISPAAVAPAVVTNAATSIATTSARLNGTVNSNGYATTYYFKWGTTTAYGHQTANASNGSGTTPVARYANISGLTTKTIYHFQICAYSTSNGINIPPGVVCGSDQSFKTN